MERRVFIIHGWGAAPEREWFPWLREQLEHHNLDVIIPAMPHTEHPVIEEWVAMLRTVAGALRPTDIFVGHSVGCQAIMRFFEQENVSSVAGFICVAGWVALRGVETGEGWAIAKPWLDTPIDLAMVKRTAGSITAIFSESDPYVDLAINRDMFEQQLGARIIIEHDKGHFSEDNGIYELPIVRDTILTLIQ